MESPGTGAVPPETSATSGTAADCPASGSQAHRLRRVLDLQRATLAKPDLLKANVGSMNCTLMRFAILIEEVVEQGLANGPRTVERLQKVQPAVDTYLRIARQVDRFAQFDGRTDGTSQPKRNFDAAGAARRPA